MKEGKFIPGAFLIKVKGIIPFFVKMNYGAHLLLNNRINRFTFKGNFIVNNDLLFIFKFRLNSYILLLLRVGIGRVRTSISIAISALSIFEKVSLVSSPLGSGLISLLK